jgi:hypothetical protein
MRICRFRLTGFAGLLGAAVAAAAGEAGRPETPLERAVRLSASAEAKDRKRPLELKEGMDSDEVAAFCDEYSVRALAKSLLKEWKGER